ncbi:hypothetical protein V8G54_010647 [Vigna mungo]|uniref:DUF4378 domain-containing protein n=1 Tax=Vigna mungo TaxID=3915 RepID=A0AAQ3NYD7_VIGMU
MTPCSSVVNDSLRRKLIVWKEMSKKRSRHHRSSTCPTSAISMNDNLLTTFVQDPVSPLVYHLDKQHVYATKTKLTRSVSFPLPDPSSKREKFEAVGNGFSPEGKGKSCFESKTPKSVQFESSKKFYLRSLSQSFNVNEAMITRDVTNSSPQDHSLNEIKHFKNLKQKIKHVIGESRKEKLRVAMDAIIDKLPQGHGISNNLKKEVFKKMTDSNDSREGENSHGRYNESDRVTSSFAKHHWNIIRRKLSLEEPLDNYFRSHEKGFNSEKIHLQSKQLKLRTEKGHSPLKMLVQRMLSLPDLNALSYPYQNKDFPDISSVTEPKPKVASGDGTLSSDNIFNQKKRPGLNLHSKIRLQSETPVEDLIQKHPDSVDENDQEISNIVEQGSECSNGKAGVATDDFGHSCFKSGNTSDDQEMIEPIKENMTAIEESVDSKLITEPGIELENIIEQQEATMDSLKVQDTIENAQKVEIQSKNLNYDITFSHIPIKDKAEFNYVKFVLEISGLTGKECLSAWHSSDHPVDPLLYEEMENDLDFCTYGGSGQCNHHVLFDLINETLLELSGRCHCCCSIPFSSSHPMPKGCHTLHQVWTHMNKSLCLRSKTGLTIDDHVSRDLERRDGWVNPKLYAQCVSLELEDFILHDLLEEISCDLACI